MKTILAFGDSLTWGSCPHTHQRHPHEDRWPDAMAAGLDGVQVISEGLRGRTSAYARPGPSELRGDLILPTLLSSHAPLDLVMIMLGTNDLYDGQPLHQVRWGLLRLVEIVKHHPYRLDGYPGPEIMLISPPSFSAGPFLGLDETMAAHSQKLAGTISELAEEQGVAFFDAARVAHAEAGDGLHLEAHISRGLGQALQDPVKALLALS